METDLWGTLATSNTQWFPCTLATNSTQWFLCTLATSSTQWFPFTFTGRKIHLKEEEMHVVNSIATSSVLGSLTKKINFTNEFLGKHISNVNNTDFNV